MKSRIAVSIVNLCLLALVICQSYWLDRERAAMSRSSVLVEQATKVLSQQRHVMEMQQDLIHRLVTDLTNCLADHATNTVRIIPAAHDRQTEL